MNPVARAFPAAPTVAAWRRQLAPRSPGPFWVADLLLHRIDALVRIEEPCRPDPLSLRILTTLARSPGLDSLEQETGLPRQFLHQALTRLHAHGLIQTPSLQLSAQGQHAVRTGTYARPATQRRAFYFRTCAGAPATFLPLSGMVGEPCQPDGDWHFDIAVLDEYLRRPQSWKEVHGFPANIGRVDMPPVDWRHVAIDTPIRWTAALVGMEPNLVRAYGWSGKDDALDLSPQFALHAEVAAEALPELAPPSAEELNAAWQQWCAAHGCSTVEATVDRLEGERLHVRGQLPEPLRRLAASDKSWLLIGAGDLRRTAQIHVEE
jgi:hypothetical protein